MPRRRARFRTRSRLNFLILKMGMNHPSMGSPSAHEAQLRQRSAGHHWPSRGPPPNDPWPVSAPDPRLVAAHAHALPACAPPPQDPLPREVRLKARKQGWPRSPGGRVFPPCLCGAWRCCKSLPSGQRGTRPQSPRGSSPGGGPRARHRSAAACPHRAAPRVAPPSAAAAQPRRRPGRGQTMTPS